VLQVSLFANDRFLVMGTVFSQEVRIAVSVKDSDRTMDTVPRAKSSVVEGVSPDGLCIMGSSNLYYQGLRTEIIERRSDFHIFEYGFSEEDAAGLFAAHFDQERLE